VHPTATPPGDTPTGWLDVSNPPPGLDRVLNAMDGDVAAHPRYFTWIDTARDPLRPFRVLAIAAAIVALGAGVVALRRRREVGRLAATV
jgi:hypothetical protein